MAGFEAKPVSAGVAGGCAAVFLGLAYLAIAGAPPRMLLMNAVALAIGIAALMVVRRASRLDGRWANALLPVLALCVLAAALFGQSTGGVSRWVTVANVTVQPGLMFGPLLIVAFARDPRPARAAALAILAMAAALQPDPALAAMLAFGAVTVAVLAPSLLAIGTVTAAICSVGLALAQPVELPAVPFVEGVYASALATSAGAFAVVLIGSALLLTPLAALRSTSRKAPVLAFAAAWWAIIAAAAFGNYPTPLLGYGGSAIVGYFLSVAMLGSLRPVEPARSLDQHQRATDNRRGTGLKFARQS